MVYSEANTILGSSLTPNNRCICKKTAVDNYADPTPLANFEYNRLVPVTAGYVSLVKYTIRFLGDGGTVVSTQQVTRGQTPSDPSASVTPPTGKHFDHWSPTICPATQNQDYEAVFSNNTYTITFLDYDDSTLQTLTVAHGQTPSPNTPSRSGYTFAGWTPSIVAATEDKTYKATYTAATSTVTYIVQDENGNTVSTTTETVNNGSYPTNYPTPAAITNYTGAWSPSDPATTVINGDITFTYSYTQNPVIMLADVAWKTAEDSGGTPYDDPSNIYMTTNYLLRPDSQGGPRIAENVWFEPWYKDKTTGNTLTNHWTDPIATVNGTNVCHEDLTWTCSIGISTNGHWWWDKPDGYDRDEGTIIIRPVDLQTSDPEDNKPGRNYRVSVQSKSNKVGNRQYDDLWGDYVPFRLIGTYNGYTVVDITVIVGPFTSS